MLNQKNPTFQNCPNIVSALHASKLVRAIYSGHKELRLIPLHFNSNGNHVRLVEQKTGKKFHIKFARQTFVSFGRYFLDGSDKQQGESINSESVQDLDRDDVIFFARPGSLERIFAGDFVEKSYKRTTKSGEQTLSVALSDLEKLL